MPLLFINFLVAGAPPAASVADESHINDVL